jgi:hypothetical protein
MQKQCFFRKILNFYSIFLDVKKNSIFDWNSRVEEKTSFSKNTSFHIISHYFYWKFNYTDDCYGYRWMFQKGYNATNLHGYTTVSFVEGYREPNLWITYHPSVLSSVVRELIAGLSSEEWHIATSPCPSKMCVVLKNLFRGYLL